MKTLLTSRCINQRGAGQLNSTDVLFKSTESKRQLAKIKKHSFVVPSLNLPKGWVWTTFLQSMKKVVDCHNKTAPYVNKGIHLIRTPTFAMVLFH
jgi:type I restriction enzyme S subunit